ncbi:hypothetical protein CPSG_02328 [Coccidioides posadasii str. Silveira]|uniref:Uncharacterized protein n=1 Tax=Coccidioides posadasii (strain RMSCC 757 / Silveira) TaxID=443226 RepID=E9CZ41_COCPS|nr:hypothetical protein CPSG_02328 [Coccidioides posadasii str. Silveira]
MQAKSPSESLIFSHISGLNDFFISNQKQGGCILPPKGITRGRFPEATNMPIPCKPAPRACLRFLSQTAQ